MKPANMRVKPHGLAAAPAKSLTICKRFCDALQLPLLTLFCTIVPLSSLDAGNLARKSGVLWIVQDDLIETRIDLSRGGEITYISNKATGTQYIAGDG